MLDWGNTIWPNTYTFLSLSKSSFILSNCEHFSLAPLSFSSTCPTLLSSPWSLAQLSRLPFSSHHHLTPTHRGLGSPYNFSPTNYVCFSPPQSQTSCTGNVMELDKEQQRKVIVSSQVLSDLRSGDLGEDSLFFYTSFATGSLKLFHLFHGWFPLGIFHHNGQSCHGLFRDRSLGSSWGAFDLILLMLGSLGLDLDSGWFWLGIWRRSWSKEWVRLCWRFLPTFLCRVEHLNFLIKLSSEQLAFAKTGSSTLLFSTYSMFDRSTPSILAVS